MAQRSQAMHDDRDGAALRRMKYFTGDWDRLNWYVQLTTKDIDSLTTGELLILQEEFAALERTLRVSDKAAKPNIKTIKAFQSTVKQHLGWLIDNDSTTLGPFQVSIELTLPIAARERGKKNNDWKWKLFGTTDTKTSTLPRVESIEIVKGAESCLLYHFARLLTRLGASIRRCKHCSNIFLQFRRHAAYCGRACQSVAAMREVRRKRKQRQAKRPRVQKKNV